MADPTDLYQAVEVTLSDGRFGRFFGPAMVFTNDEGKVDIKAVVFVTPCTIKELMGEGPKAD